MKLQSLLRSRIPGVLVCFFLSGIAGLIYQVAWSKALGLIFGHTIYAVAVVLAVFMAGLAAGSAYFGSRSEDHPNPVVLYAWLEFLAAAGGALSLLGLAGVRWLYIWAYAAVGSRQPLLLALRVLGASLVLFLPTFLMGGTLPVLVRGITRHSREFGVRVSQLYWVNTAGAVLGTLISGFALLPALGLRLTIACAVPLNVLAGLLAWWTARADESLPANVPLPGPAKPAPLTPPAGEVGPRVLLLVFAAVGCTAFVYEIAWTRLLSITVGSSTYAFTLMLATFLAGSVMGSAVFQRFGANSSRISRTTLARSQLAIGIAAVSSLVVFRWVPALIAQLLQSTHASFGGLVFVQLLASVLTVLPAAAFFGFNFPLVILLFDRSEHGGRGRSAAVGKAYAANTAGAIAGSIVTGFWLIPWLGTFRVIVLAAAVNLLLSLVLNLSAPRRRLLPLALDLICVAGAVAVGGSSFFNNRSLLSLSAVLYGNSHPGLSFEESAAMYDLVFAADGVNDSIAVLRTDDTLVLRVNGKVDASTGDAPTQLLLAHLGAVFHSGPKRVLIIGFGSGMTAYAMSLYPDIEKIDCVEIEPAVIRAAPYLESLNHDVLRDPRVHVILDDARNFLLTSREKYDLIISEPSNPWIAGVATLFTDEYYAAARKKLAPGGIFVQWVQAYSLEPADLRMIMATFAPHFPEVTLWRGVNPDLLLLGRTDPKPFQFDRLKLLWPSPELRKSFESIQVHKPAGLMAYYLLDDPEVRKLAAGSRINTDDRTLLEYDAPRALLKRDLSQVNQELITRVRAGPLPRNWKASEVRPALQESMATAFDINDTTNADSLLQALEAEPPSVATYVGQGRWALNQGDLAKAKSFLQNALVFDPDSTEALHWLAVVERRSGDNASAKAHAEEALRANPKFLPAMEDQMLLATDRKDFRDAVTAELDRIALMPEPPAYEYCRLGSTWMEIPNYTVAETALLRGLQRDPYSYACHLELGELYRRTDRLPLARKYFEWVVRFFPDTDPSIFRQLAAVDVLLGDNPSARSTLEKGHRIFPHDGPIQRAQRVLGG